MTTRLWRLGFLRCSSQSTHPPPTYLSVVELPVYVDLSLGDVASEVRDGMGDIWTEEGREGGGREAGSEGKRGRERERRGRRGRKSAKYVESEREMLRERKVPRC